MIKVLISDAFKKFLLKQPPEYRRKIRQKFEYLEIGYWEGGLNVKKIKGAGVNKAIFEARLDRGDRILFTIGNGENNRQDLMIYVWGVVSHDEVSRSVQNIPANAPFLQFKPYREEDFREETSLEELEPSYCTQESITQKVYDDFPTQRWHVLDEKNWQRIQDYREEDFELPLYLTPAQEELLHKPLPLIVSGTAGSGKTTLSIYYLLKIPLAQQKKLFITYNEFLRKSAYRLYYALLNAAPWQEEFQNPHFYTFKEYCLAVAATFGKNFAPEDEINFDRFNQIIRNNSQARQFDPPLIWEEIRSIIKGALPQLNLRILEKALTTLKHHQLSPTLLSALQQQLLVISQLESLKKVEKFVQKYVHTDLETFAHHIHQLTQKQPDRVLSALDRILNTLQKERKLFRRKYLSYMDYEALGRKKAPNFAFDRKRIYGIFEWYQDFLEREGRWDELDLTREVMNLMAEREAEDFRYDVVVCDEVQDLTDVQHELLFYIVRHPQNLLLTGDIRQIINPSSFRWEELRRHFYEREMRVPDIHILNLNFRSSGSIVELSNTLLELKSRLLGVHSEEHKEEWKYKGRPPVVVHGLNEPELLKSVQITGARKTILVRTETEKAQLQKVLDTELIFTIYEAKGLEFDTVLLWKFAHDVAVQDVWKSILRDAQPNIHEAKIRHEINLLYVAITRARQDLLIYDGKQSSLIWQNDFLKDKVYPTDDVSYIGSIWNVISTPEEWKEQGDYFFERGFYRAAAECYKNAGQEDLVLMARAYQAEKVGDFSAAAPLFEQIGEEEKAAQYYEKREDYEAACRLWEKLGHDEAALRCRLALLEREGKYGEAGEIYLSRKEFDKAVIMLEKAKRYEQAAEICLRHLKDRKAAARYYRQAGAFKKAAKLYRALKRPEEAADLYEKAGDYAAAIRLWKQLKREDRLISLYFRTRSYAELLSIFEKRNDLENTVKVLKQIPDKSNLAREAEQLFATGKYFPALARYYYLKDHPRIAECFSRLKEFSQAARHYELAGMFYQAGRLYQKDKQYREAFACYLRSEEDRRDDFAKAKRLRHKLRKHEIEEEARRLLQEKRSVAAAFCYAWLEKYDLAGQYALEGGDLEKAEKYWSQIIRYDYGIVDFFARVCLDYNQVEWGAKFALKYLPKQLRYRYEYMRFDFQLAPRENLLRLMDAYFEQHPDQEEMQQWVEYLDHFHMSGEYLVKRLEYLEKTAAYNEYFITLQRLSNHLANGSQPLMKRLRKEYDFLVKEVSEMAAIKLFFLGKQEEFEHILEKLEVTPDNYELFIHSRFWEKAIDVLVQNGEMERLRQLLIDKNRFLQLAQIYEQQGMLNEAAHYYGAAPNLEHVENPKQCWKKSGQLFEQLGQYYKAGDAYYKAGSYQKALEMYQKSGKGKAKIAKTYEKLGDYASAARMWQELGKPKNAQKCLQKLSTLRMFDK